MELEKWQSVSLDNSAKAEHTLRYGGKVYTAFTRSVFKYTTRRLTLAIVAVLGGSLLALLKVYSQHYTTSPISGQKNKQKVNNKFPFHFQCSHWIYHKLYPMFPSLLGSNKANKMNKIYIFHKTHMDLAGRNVFYHIGVRQFSKD